MPIPFYALNDFAVTVSLESINSTTGAKEPLTAGTVTAFISNNYTPTATAADPTLEVSAVHLNNPAGTWLIFFDASVLTPSLLGGLFVEDVPYLIVVQPNGIRAYAELEYYPSRAGTVV